MSKRIIDDLVNTFFRVGIIDKKSNTKKLKMDMYTNINNIITTYKDPKELEIVIIDTVKEYKNNS
jgi:hypothetical protein